MRNFFLFQDLKHKKLRIFLKGKPTNQNGWRSTNFSPPSGFVEWRMRVRGRGESPQDTYRVGRAKSSEVGLGGRIVASGMNGD